MKEIKLKIDGMSCSHCQKALESAIGQLDGVNSVEVDLETETAKISVDDESRLEQIRATVTEAGYTPK